MSYHLFFDDEREPEDVFWVKLPSPSFWVVARSVAAFKECIEKNGLPGFLTFDHDLAPEHYLEGRRHNFEFFDYSCVTTPTGLEAARWLVDHCRKNQLPLPRFAIHTQNPYGGKRILEQLNALKDTKTKQARRKPPLARKTSRRNSRGKSLKTA